MAPRAYSVNSIVDGGACSASAKKRNRPPPHVRAAQAKEKVKKTASLAVGKVLSRTYLTERAREGEKKIEVASMDGIKIGQILRIGSNGLYEQCKVAEFGSLILEQALRRDHEVGEEVIIVEENASEPRSAGVNITVELDGERQSGDDSATDASSTNMKDRKSVV